MAFLEKLAIKIRLMDKEKLVYAFVALMIVACILIALGETNVLSDKWGAKISVRRQLEQDIANEEVTFESLDFDTVTAKKFKTRAEDPVGYFAYIEGESAVIDTDGTRFENHLAYYRRRYGDTFDPEADTKWAYILTGTYEATHKEHGAINGEFYVKYVTDRNGMCFVERRWNASDEMLRQTARGDLQGYLTVTYDLPTPADIEITHVEKEWQNGYYLNCTVYGVITVKDKFGDTYRGKFVGEYQSNVEDQVFIQKKLEIEELFKSSLLDLLLK
ncbi:MAG: hypothetical protein IKU57_01190 [Oscillospiraceae bacterium]|nr:hypothetical protein [Oscillospiraceae bacterium]